MERWTNKVAIVTGASSGIGEAIANSLVRVGMLVVGMARRFERVQANADSLDMLGAKGKLHAVKCDVRVEEDVLKAFEWTTQNVGNVHVLVNCAGVVPKTNLAEGVTEDWRQVLEINVLGLCIATREALKIMKTNKIDGQIIHINSIAGHMHFYHPSFGLYPASKHAVTNLSEILRQEMIEQQTNVKVTSISPGVVKTEIFQINDRNEELWHGPALDSQDVADAVLYVLGVPQHVLISELTIRPLKSPL